LAVVEPAKRAVIEAPFKHLILNDNQLQVVACCGVKFGR